MPHFPCKPSRLLSNVPYRLVYHEQTAHIYDISFAFFRTIYDVGIAHFIKKKKIMENLI